MLDYAIVTDFLFFSEEKTPISKLILTKPKFEQRTSEKTYNGINKWITISETDKSIFLTILPTQCGHGKLFICPPINEDSAISLGQYIKNWFSKPVNVEYIVYNSNDNSLNSEHTKHFHI